MRAVGLAMLWLASAAAIDAASVEVSSQAAAEGPHGLQVNFGPDCASAQDLVLDADDGPLTGTYEACRTLWAESVAVPSGSVTLRAGDEISLDEGFAVFGGASFATVLDSGLSGGDTWVQDASPIAETVYTANFSARFDDLVLGAGERVGNLVAYSPAGEVVFRLAIEPAPGGGFELALEALQDGGGLVQTPPGEEVGVAAGWNIVRLEWSAGSGDGALLVAVNGGPLSGLTALDNGATLVETIRWGAVDGAVFDSSGAVQLDSFSSTR